LSGDEGDPLVDLIYATAFDPTLWPDAMTAVADRVGGMRATLTRFDARTASGQQFATRTDPAALAAYADYFHTTNVFARRTDVSVFTRGWRPNVGVESSVVDWDAYQASEFCNDYVRPQGYNAQLFIRLGLDGETATTLSIGRAIADGRFEARDLEIANTLLPHLARAYSLGRSLSNAFGVSRDLAVALEQLPDAAVLVDPQGRVRLANPAAERLLAQRRGLSLVAGRLVAEHSDAARNLERLLGLATRPDGQRTGGLLRLPLAGHRLPLAARVAPIGVQAHPALGRQHMALVSITDLEGEIAAPEEALRDLFALTPAEARLAGAVFEGLTLAEAAERFGISVNTARFQLARTFDKTGVARQAELVKLMMRLAASPGV
jgi:DNA-binding CsgD family transcriptional regulator